MADILLVSNPSHPGITFIADAYCRAFQHLGIDFHYLTYQEWPKISVQQAGSILLDKVELGNYNKVIIVQPTFLMLMYVNKLMEINKRKGTEFYCINTEDPYSTSALMIMNPLFKIKFTNEKLVADRLKNMSYIYLPVAFDSLFPYKQSDKKEYNISYIATFYLNRLKYLEGINKFKDIYIDGNLAPLIENKVNFLDMKLFGKRPDVVSRHKELEIYSKSRFVLNPYRDPAEVGYSFLYIIKGMKCEKMFDNAFSPNPRFFDALGCGAVPMNSLYRKECDIIISKYSDYNFHELFYIDETDSFEKSTRDKIKFFNDITENLTALDDVYVGIRIHESYIKRAKVVLEKINEIKSI